MNDPHFEPVWTRRRTLRASLLVAVAYYLGVLVGLALTMRPHPISTLWPPNAILLAGLLLAPRRAWWALLLAALPAHLLGELPFGFPPLLVLSWYVSNVSEAVIGAGLMRLLERSPRLDSFRGAAVFIICGAFVASGLSSFLDAAFVSWNAVGPDSYWQLWNSRFFANVLATLALVPVIVHSVTGGVSRLSKVSLGRYIEAGLLAAGLVVVCVIIFMGGSKAPALLYVPLPFLLWAAVRFGPAGASASLLVLALVAIAGAGQGHEPFAAPSVVTNTLSAQLFLAVISVPLLVLAAVMEERRRGEVSLRESEERFSLAFRLSPVAFAITRRHDGRILDVNERWEAMLGHPRTEVVGRSIAGLGMFLHPDEAQRFMDRLSSDGAVRDLELELRNRAGALRRTVLTAQSVTLADEPCFLIAVRDITDRRRVQAELDEQRAELAHLARVSLVGELSAALAHELNQPLAAIMANARAGQRLMTRQPPDVPEVRSILEDVTDDARRAGQVISRLHALLKRGELQLNPVDLNEVVSEVLELVHSELIQREVVVETRLAGALPRVPGDRVQLQQVLINLLLNACDAMSAEPRERRRVLITTVGNNGAVVLSVADQGVGIPDGKLEQVFEPLYTSKPHGLGLGLSICRTIVTAHGGRLWAAHNPDHGATFHLLLGQEDGKVL